jgi:signal transduction histidine kinase
LRLSKERFNLRELLIDIVHDYEESPANEDKEVRLICPLEKMDESIFMQADKVRVKQVISNLLSNAFGFTREGTVSITVEKEAKDGGQFISVSVRDTGSGIEPEIFPVMFEKFTTRSEKGTGLGLFISRGIVEAHGGQIWGKNNDDNDRKKGTTFTFTLPIADQQQQQQQEPVPRCKPR